MAAPQQGLYSTFEQPWESPPALFQSDIELAVSARCTAPRLRCFAHCFYLISKRVSAEGVKINFGGNADPRRKVTNAVRGQPRHRAPRARWVAAA